MKLFEKHPDYRLYCTGHSLGGALATIFGANAAASDDPRIPKPVTVIAIACPKVGNRDFQKAFKVRYMPVTMSVVYLIAHIPLSHFDGYD